MTFQMPTPPGNNSNSSYQYGQGVLSYLQGGYGGGSGGGNPFQALGMTTQQLQKGLSASDKKTQMMMSPGLRAQDAMIRDYMDLKGLNEGETQDRMHFRGQLGDYIERMKTGGQEAFDSLNKYADELSPWAEKRAEQDQGRLDKYLDEIRQYKQDTDAQAKATADEYLENDMTNISAQLSGTGRAFQQNMDNVDRMVQSGSIRADEAAAMKSQMRNERAQQLHSMGGELMNRRSQLKAQLGMQTAGVMAGTGSTVTNALIAAGQQSSAISNFAANMKLRSMDARLQAVQAKQTYESMELQGMGELAGALKNLGPIHTDLFGAVTRAMTAFNAYGGMAQRFSYGTDNAKASGWMGGSAGTLPGMTVGGEWQGAYQGPTHQVARGPGGPMGPAGSNGFQGPGGVTWGQGTPSTPGYNY